LVPYILKSVASNRGSSSIRFIIGLSGCGRGRIQTPLGPQGFVNRDRGGELKVAGLLGDNCALMHRCETGD